MSKLIIDMPKKYLTDASGFVSCAMCEKYLPLLHRDCHKDFKGCLIKGVLPEEHGDLIDRDKLKRAFCNHCDGRDTMNGELNCTEPCFDLGLMDCMPVIIAAERKDNGTTAD